MEGGKGGGRGRQVRKETGREGVKRAGRQGGRELVKSADRKGRRQ